MKFVSFSALLSAVFGVHAVCAEQMPNPRSARVVNVAPQRADGAAVVRGNGANVVSGASRGAMARAGVVAVRNVSDNNSRATMSRSATRQDSGRRADVTTARNAKNAAVVRSAISGLKNNARSASNVSSGLARAAARSRATAVFSDVSKIGGAYSACREAYATCMDQFCANANDTYRRCYCSSRFTEFRDTENALDEAKILMQRFEDNNLNAVDKTAAEVSAMYSASIGEAAIKNDTSGAQQLLNEIGDLLSGKKKTDENQNNDLNLLTMDFTTDMSDIWGGTGSSIFDSDTGVNLSELEGQQLYNASNKQCLEIMGDQCENEAVLNMATSAYGIMITQDCNMYEKTVDKKRESVMNTVRQAEKVLRDARLEEYRAHNSQDVNQCIDKVRIAIQKDTACGANYKRCLDYSGAYVNTSTGEIIYSPKLFNLSTLINLDGSFDVLGKNSNFNEFLDSRKMFATSALDTCRDLSDIVWTEFKRAALIEIAQAQEALLEEVRMSCVSTITECYDTQSGAMKDFDSTTAQVAGAISAMAAKEMCADKVTTCASLYGDGKTECEIDPKTGDITNAAACGAEKLISFIDTVDSTRIAEGCRTALENRLKETCTPTTGDMGYPWNCRLMALDNGDNSLKTTIESYAKTYCQVGDGNQLTDETKTIVNSVFSELKEEVEYQLMDVCESLDGYWIADDDQWASTTGRAADNTTNLSAFYASVWNSKSEDDTDTWGRCVENTTMVKCLAYNDEGREENYATYNREKDECTFSEEWYQLRCSMLGNGYYENGVCYIAPTSEE